MKFARAAIATLIFGGVLMGVYFVHVRFLPVDVVFYSAIFDALIAAAISGVILYRGHAFRVLSPFERFQMLVIWLLAGYALAISVPTVIDRSLSFYILEKLQQRGGGIQLSRFEEVFTKEYAVEHKLVDIRLTEQEQSGTIVIEGGCVRLTPRGDRLASFSRFFRENLLPRHRLLMGKYSDVLVNPFRNGGDVVNYRC